MKYLFFLLISLRALSDPIRIAIVDMGIDKSEVGYNIVKSKETEGIDYAKRIINSYHGTYIANSYKKEYGDKIQIIDIVYSDGTGPSKRLQKYRFPERKIELIRKERIEEEIDHNIYLSFKKAIELKANIINFSSSIEKDRLYIREIIRDNPEVIFIVSAGNMSRNLDLEKNYPCSYKYKNVICVGSNDEYSNYGNDVDFKYKSIEHKGTSFLTFKALGPILLELKKKK
tara:strand:- start:2292 stop:2978 length:687 start_codon:yes stop_codon:yes gene_type:complete